MGSPKPNGWLRAYAEAPEVLHAFAQAEDPDGLVANAFADAADLDRQVADVLGPQLADTANGGDRIRPELCGASVRVLEIGCGTCRISRGLAERPAVSTWIGVDSAAALLEFAHRTSPTLPLLHAKAEQLPFASGAFDAVFAAWVLGYLRPAALQIVLQECRRALRPGGSIWAMENADAGPTAMPRDGNIRGLLDSGFQVVREIQTELRFPDSKTARSITHFLMGNDAPESDAQGRIPHAVSLLRLTVS